MVVTANGPAAVETGTIRKFLQFIFKSLVRTPIARGKHQVVQVCPQLSVTMLLQSIEQNRRNRNFSFFFVLGLKYKPFLFCYADALPAKINIVPSCVLDLLVPLAGHEEEKIADFLVRIAGLNSASRSGADTFPDAFDVLGPVPALQQASDAVQLQ